MVEQTHISKYVSRRLLSKLVWFNMGACYVMDAKLGNFDSLSLKGGCKAEAYSILVARKRKSTCSVI